MQKKWLLVLGTVAILAIAFCAFWYYHPTHHAYNDRWIVGNMQDNIIARYGAFQSEQMDENGALHCGIYQIRDNTSELIMGYDDSLWYEIYFENSIAIRVELRRGYIGS